MHHDRTVWRALGMQSGPSEVWGERGLPGAPESSEVAEHASGWEQRCDAGRSVVGNA